MYIKPRLALDFICLAISLGRDAWRKPLANIGCVLTKDDEETLLARMRRYVDMKKFLDYGPLRDALHTTTFQMFAKYRAEVHWMKYFLWRLHTVFPENIAKEFAVRTVLEAKAFSAQRGSKGFNQNLSKMRRRNRRFVRRFSYSPQFADLLQDVCDRSEAMPHRVIR